MNYFLPSSFLLNTIIEHSKKEFLRIEEIIDKIDESKKIAIYGTGSHTARLLGMSSLKEKNIVKFYDSDEKKQNFTMMGLPITKFSVDDISNGVIEIIIISTFSSERAIYEFLTSCGVNDKLIVTLYS